MKKRILALTLSLLLALGISACGTDQKTPNEPAAGSSGQNVPNGSGTGEGSDQNTPNSSGTGDFGTNTSGGTGTDGSFSFSSLTEFYNSQYRPLLEDTMNEIFTEVTDLHGYITIEEPDILIFNYQYNTPLSSIGLSHEEAAAITASNLLEADYSVQAVNTIKEFQSYGVPLRVVRTNYLDADGSLVYSADFTEDSGSSGLPDNSELPGSSGTSVSVYADLQEWMDSSEDAALTVQSTNQALASTGITFDLAVEGNILVYKYYLPDAFFADGLAEEEQTAAFDSMVDAGSASVDTVFSVFMEKYGLSVDAVRFAYYSLNGTELYSRDVTP